MIIKLIRDWLRGWSDIDLLTVRSKLGDARASGEITWISDREMKAHLWDLKNAGTRMPT